MTACSYSHSIVYPQDDTQISRFTRSVDISFLPSVPVWFTSHL